MFSFKKWLYGIQLQSFNPLYRFIYSVAGALVVSAAGSLAAWLIIEKIERNKLEEIIEARALAEMCYAGGEEAAAAKLGTIFNQARELFASDRFAVVAANFVKSDERPRTDPLKEIYKNDIKSKDVKVCVSEGSRNKKIRLSFELAGYGVFPLGPIYCFDRANPRCAEQSCIFNQSGELIKIFVKLFSKSALEEIFKLDCMTKQNKLKYKVTGFNKEQPKCPKKKDGLPFCSGGLLMRADCDGTRKYSGECGNFKCMGATNAPLLSSKSYYPDINASDQAMTQEVLACLRAACAAQSQGFAPNDSFVEIVPEDSIKFTGGDAREAKFVNGLGFVVEAEVGDGFIESFARTLGLSSDSVPKCQ